MTKPSYSKVSWNNTGTTSDLIKMDGNQCVGFLLPATIASTSFTFQTTYTLNVSSGSPIWINVCDSGGSAISFTTSASTAAYYGFSQDQIAKFTGVEAMRMKSGSSEVANQDIRVVLVPRPSI